MPVFMVRRTSLQVATALLTIAALLVIPGLVARFRRTADQPHLSAFGAGASDGLLNSSDDSISALQQRIRDHPNELISYVSLAQAYLQKVRETGDPSLYTKTEALLNSASKIDGQDAELVATRGMLDLARHDFAGALTLGKQALSQNAAAARYYGVVADAQVELGMYDEAVQTLQAMVDHRPDFSSFSRIAYMRELYGDTDGAIMAMQRAITAGAVVPENGAWAYVQLGNLAFGIGKIDQAREHYGRALRMVENYPAALAGQARIATTERNFKRAATLYQQAFNRNPLSEYAIALGDVYTHMGDTENAKRQYDLVIAIDKLLTANGVNTDLETALFFADHDIDIPASLTKARAAYAARPSIHTADGLAWTLYKTGAAAQAQHYAAEALKLGTHDALKLFHAGMIAKALGQTDQAKRHLQAAVDLNPHFSLLYSNIAAATLRELGARNASEGSK
jgi:tetratricopeptide (TPR) repeat protein